MSESGQGEKEQPGLTAGGIRKAFLDFFRSKGHEVVPSAPIVVKNDPTLMFTNAGMNQFKDYFLGNQQSPHPRVADTQKCLRVSGKHNDLEEVGVDTYHHTMFEMLGNWSFGDYFKKEAIEWSWELLTEVLGLQKDRLYVTIFEGDSKEGLPKDEEAAAEWKKWVPEGRILPYGKKDNFWEMGDTGPCGPCTEIHVDCRRDNERAEMDGKTLVNNDHPQVIEIWNNVFIQYNRLKDGSLQQLPARHVDTGMGFERLVRVLQGKTSNYDTDIFSGIIGKIEEITSKRYHYSDSKVDIAFRVLADHIRAIAFTIADGQLPSNTGAGYVIRRILRRAVRYYYSYLGYQQPLLHQLLPVIADQFAEVFPELKKQQDFVERIIREEEESFLRTLGKGLMRIYDFILAVNKRIVGNLKNLPNPYTLDYPFKEIINEKNYPELFTTLMSWDNSKQDIVAVINAVHEHTYFAGDMVFELYDTHGFPLDLTKLIASEIGLKVDESGFEGLMQYQKNRSRAATAIDTEDWITINEGTKNEFVGYDSLETKANILRYRKVKAKGRELYQIVLDKTPFYAESGGQVGDTGELLLPSPAGEGPGMRLPIIDTKKENDLIIHFAESGPEGLTGEVTAKVDAAKRANTAIHHSATHLLHAALRQVLGSHVAQKGSLVNADHLRFDFSHFSKLTGEEIARVEAMVNEKIRQNIPVVIQNMPKEEAVKTGAMALFGEKYGDTVRVVTMDPAYSVELCGGTHAGATGGLGFFKITSESAVAAGVRRIEAVSGAAAEDYINNTFSQLEGVKEALKSPKDILKAITSLSEEATALRRKMEGLEAVQLKTVVASLLPKAQHINGVAFIGETVAVSGAEALKKLAFELKPALTDYVIVLTAAIEGKAAVVLLFDEAIAQQKGLDAGALIKQKIAPLIKGGGGGQKTLATAGGADVSALHAVINTVKALL